MKIFTKKVNAIRNLQDCILVYAIKWSKLALLFIIIISEN